MFELIVLIIMIMLFLSLGYLVIKNLLDDFCSITDYVVNGLMLLIIIGSIILLGWIIYVVYWKGAF
jgi:uncharacterized protein YacL